MILFATLPNNLGIISDTSTDGKFMLSQLIGETLSSFIRDKNNPLELLRINRGEKHKIVVRRRFNDIAVNIYDL